MHFWGFGVPGLCSRSGRLQPKKKDANRRFEAIRANPSNILKIQLVTWQGYPLEKGTGELLRSFVPSKKFGFPLFYSVLRAGELLRSPYVTCPLRSLTMWLPWKKFFFVFLFCESIRANRPNSRRKSLGHLNSKPLKSPPPKRHSRRAKHLRWAKHSRRLWRSRRRKSRSVPEDRLQRPLFEGAQTVKCKPWTERVAEKGAVETGVKSSLKKVHKPWIRGKKGAQTVN